MTAHRTKRGTMTQQELDTILESHGKWLVGAVNGESQADLSNLDLRGLDLRGAKLRKAVLRNSDLSGVDLHEMDLSAADLSYAQLTGCNLRGALLRDADLRGAKLKDAQLCDADLCGATLHEVNLTAAHGLVERQLAGTDLSNAELPAGVGKFDALGKVTDVSVQARTLLWITVAACLFSVITMFVTTDAAIVARAGSAQVPVVRFDVPILVFSYLTPFVLLGLYLYLHFQLQYLWTGLASLPSVFPDGTSLDERAYPLFLVGLVRWYVPILKKHRPPLCWLQVASSFASVWGLVPVTLFLFWLRYIRMHEIAGTFLHIVALVAATAFGLASYGLTAQTLGNPGACADELSGQRTHQTRAAVRWVVVGGAVFVVCGLASYAAFTGWTDSMGPIFREFCIDCELKNWTCADFRFRPVTSANLDYGEISHKPNDWESLSDSDPKKLARVVKGALLAKVNLRGATGVGAFLVNATLADADLQGANLSYADLRACDLTKANLRHARLHGADLQGAHLTYARLQCAMLTSAKLNDANLSGAKLYGANLYGAELRKADLRRAEFQCTGTNSNLEQCQCLQDEVDFASSSQIQRFPYGYHARTNLCNTKMQGANLKEAQLHYADLAYAQLQEAKLEEASLLDANLTSANLTGANLARAKLRKANLKGADLSGAWFQETEIQGADLSQAKNLDEKQLSGACCDEDTKLPPVLEKKLEER